MAGGAHSGRSHSRFNIQICSKCLPLYKYIKSLQGISTQFTLHTIAHWVDILDLVLCICSCSVPLIASMEQRVGVFRMSPSSEDSFLCCTVKCYMYNLELLCGESVLCLWLHSIGHQDWRARLVNDIHSDALSGTQPTWEHHVNINPYHLVSHNMFWTMLYSYSCRNKLWDLDWVRWCIAFLRNLWRNCLRGMRGKYRVQNHGPPNYTSW